MPFVDPLDDAAMRIAAHNISPLPRPPRTSVKHASFVYADERNQANTVRGIGFRGRCECGAESRPLASFAMARAWNREHVRNVHRAVEREAASPTRGTEV